MKGYGSELNLPSITPALKGCAAKNSCFALRLTALPFSAVPVPSKISRPSTITFVLVVLVGFCVGIVFVTAPADASRYLNSVKYNKKRICIEKLFEKQDYIVLL